MKLRVTEIFVLSLPLALAIFASPASAIPISQQAYLKASNAGAGDIFGNVVAISGDTVVVGADREASNATWVNNNQGDNSAADAGAAYVYVRNGTNWVQQAYLKASNTGAGDHFAETVAISGDTIVIGAHAEDSNATGVNGDQSNNSAASAGVAYVFVRNGTNWTQQTYLKASNTGGSDFFGISVAISGDTIVVGAALEASNATGVNGDQSNNSLSFAGAAYVFVRNGSNWTQQAYLKASNTGASDLFGNRVAISGDTIVVGANAESSAAPGVNGNQADNSVGSSGAAYIFVRSGTNWSQQAYLKASNPGAGDHFGFPVAVSGDTVAVAANEEDSDGVGVNGNQANNNAANSGAVYVFTRIGTNWSQQAYLKASNAGANDRFGYSIAVTGDTLAIAAVSESSNANGVNGNENDNSLSASGAAYVFVRSGTNWSQQAYLKASNPDVNDSFGNSIGLSSDTVVIGAPNESSNATGVNGDQSNNSSSVSGAAYVFTGLNFLFPRLSIVRSDAEVVLSWPTNAEGFTLQSATDLTPPVDWTDSAVGTQFTVTNAASESSRFYRLKK
ncbi:MAG: Integrin alpha beta-propellor repeat protein [Verrucomicrobiales bacterium]|nr:Integrin alpha beta-propellor repeat protein [Verrucomicrobiales bacterium]